MVLGGARNKTKQTPNNGTQAQNTTKKAPVSSATFTSQKRNKPKMLQHISPGNSDSESELTLPHTSFQEPVVPSNILKQFEKMLHKALRQTSEQITNNLTKEIRELGQRTASLELKVEDIESTTQDCVSELEILKEENITLQNRLEDYENRTRRSNIRLRGIPETVIDLQATVTALCQELLPGIPQERLEMDRVHRALKPKKVDGPPRDIIAKFHFYKTKEQLLNAAREMNNLVFQGYNYQLFADISQLTISKRRSMKPQLIILQQHNIKYQWGFPFSLRFTHQGNRISCRTAEELQQTLQDLNLVEGNLTTTVSRRRSASTSSLQNAHQSEAKNGTQHLNKRGRFASLPQSQEDSMD